MSLRTCWIFLLVAVLVSAQDTADSCPPNFCGEKAICKMLDGTPKCECPEGLYGNPWRRCMAVCEKDDDCSSNWLCEKFRCQPACSAKACGDGAECSVVDHRPICKCYPGFKGNPNVQCLPECANNTDCPISMLCYFPRCVDPCQFSCGKEALCEIENYKVMCRCPKGMTGNPLQRCRPTTPEEICSPNPCGINAVCTPKKDEDGYLIASCSCQIGYFGSPLLECTKGNCINHSDCPIDKICRRYQCINPCNEKVCPPNASCMVISHRVYCLLK